MDDSIEQSYNVPTRPNSFKIPDGKEIQDALIKGKAKFKQGDLIVSTNDSLFSTFSYLNSEGLIDRKISNYLRLIIARCVSSNPEIYTTAFLGMTIQDYCEWVLNKINCGGVMELSVLCSYFEVEVKVIDINTHLISKFGDGKRHNERFFMLSDGVHYSSLVLEWNNHSIQYVFSSDDNKYVLEKAMEIAKEVISIF